ncbi:hypothetical protein [Caballeronia sp. KNU42]
MFSGLDHVMVDTCDLDAAKSGMNRRPAGLAEPRGVDPADWVYGLPVMMAAQLLSHF